MDAHGVQNLFAEEDAWATNLMTAQTDAKSDEIIGGNLNSLLKGLILLFSKQYKYLPCPPTVWSDAVGSIFLCLYKCSLLESCLHRLDILFIQLENFSALNIPKVEIVIYCRGAIEFMKTWVVKFPHCLSEEDFVKLHHIACKLNHKLTTTASIYLDLRIDVSDLYKIMSAEMQTRYSLHSLPPIYDYHLSIDIPVSLGTFSASGGNETATEKLKASLASKENKFKLEIFGGDAFLDEVSDEEEEDAAAADAAAAAIAIETPRVEKGLDLLHDSSVVKGKFWDLDLLEIARQWTLVDHMLFRTLNVASLLASSSSSIPLYHHSYKNGGTKKSIDRFNIGSSWLTYSILTISSAEKRAQHISKLIALAKHMCTLGNFHGLMTVLTALQQGCVHRLKITFDMLQDEDKESMQELKVLMAGEKNYMRYREEIQSRVLKIEDLKDPATDSTVKAIVPHLAAHAAALTAIVECHGDYMAEKVHLFNLVKWKQCSTILEFLRKMQQFNYMYVPVRMIINVMHEMWNEFARVENKDSNVLAKKFYALSEQLESSKSIEQYFHKKAQANKPPSEDEEESSEEEGSEEKQSDSEPETTAKYKLSGLMKMITKFKMR